MLSMSDEERLLSEQYKNSGNLEARVQLHELYSTNRQGWPRWVFERLRVPANGHVLELGCGPARLFWALKKVPKASWKNEPHRKKAFQSKTNYDHIWETHRAKQCR